MSASPDPPPTARAPLFALSLGHGCADLSNSALFALLPFLLVERHYSFAAAGVFAPLGIVLRPEWAALIMAASTIIVVINAALLRRARITGAPAAQSGEG